MGKTDASFRIKADPIRIRTAMRNGSTHPFQDFVRSKIAKTANAAHGDFSWLGGKADYVVLGPLNG
jgi:hypothetical protein